MLVDLLATSLHTLPEETYFAGGMLKLSDLMGIYRGVGKSSLKEHSFNPRIPAQLATSEDIFSIIRKGDILLHRPYDSFAAVVDFVQSAAEDPDVVAIKQTLYRTESGSVIVEALAQAAQRGKQVTAIVELQARFDEMKNIAWARRLEEAGVQVVYGLVGIKTHSKICVVVRREASGLRRYVHLSTGNYNATTSQLYTDIDLLTANEDIGEDALQLMTLLTGSFGVIIQRDLRKIFSWLIVCHIGYMIAGMSMYTTVALTGVLFYLIHDIIIKTNLFLAGGIIHKIKGTLNMDSLGGMYSGYPALSLVMAVIFFSLAGIPPLSGFWPKIYLFEAGFGTESFGLMLAIIVASSPMLTSNPLPMLITSPTAAGTSAAAMKPRTVSCTKRRRKLTLVHKTNVLVHAGAVWSRLVGEVGEEFPDVEVDYLHIDAATIFMTTDPARFDVIVTDNLFGDIITDLAAAITGGIGLAASGNVNPDRTAPSMFEPVHGSAPDIAGQQKADPTAAILSGALLLEHLGLEDDARRVETAVIEDLASRDAGTVRRTAEIGDAVAARISG